MTATTVSPLRRAGRYLLGGFLGGVGGIVTWYLINAILSWRFTPGSGAGRGDLSRFYFELLSASGYFVTAIILGLVDTALSERARVRRGWRAGMAIGLAAGLLLALVGNWIELFRSRYVQYDHLFWYSMLSLACVVAGAITGRIRAGRQEGASASQR